ncbi:sodium channel protein Nach [Musca vetustissima]|uniref:sodium channel protein Nach n=1 Tax=Musca vetustissima TaxID=27455 RepID=UPI002AB77009|nr:sodium channel protein Nach [Musca vetustissima]
MGQVELQPEDIDESITALQGALKRTWCAFCATTSIHGLKYARDEDTNKYIRFLWYLITVIMFICAIVMVFTFYVDYRSNPTRMNVENDHAPIDSILFPATTICPEVFNNIEKSKAYLETLTIPGNTTVSELVSLLGIDYGFMYDDRNYAARELELFDELLELNDLDILDFARNMAWNCNDLIYKCRFKDVIVPCDSLFYISSTFNGFCCAFNLNQSYYREFKFQLAAGGFQNGLSLILYYNDAMYNKISSYSIGFKVMIQEANAFPSAHSAIKFIPLNEEVFISVRPVETFCSKAVKDLTFEERQCTFPYERQLTYFRSYVAANCELNCRVTMMVKFCGCHTYFFYSNRTNDRICTYRDIPCLVENFANIIGRLKKNQCPCVNSCEKVEYNVQATSAKLDLNIDSIDEFYDGLKKDYSVVHIYMNSEVYRRVRHDLLSNMVTLVSNLGSAFSLFVGMSMVSAVEIVYYFTVILKKFYRQEKNAREKLFNRRKEEAESRENVQNN